MTDTLYLVRDPSGKPYACSVIDEAMAIDDAVLLWEAAKELSIQPYGLHAGEYVLINGYTCDTITLPSAHDAAIVTAAEAHITVFNVMARADVQTQEMFNEKYETFISLHDAVRAKRAAQETP